MIATPSVAAPVDPVPGGPIDNALTGRDSAAWSVRPRDEYDTPEFRDRLLEHFREAVRLAQSDRLAPAK